MTVGSNVQSRISNSPAETEEIAAEFARRLSPGDVVLLAGELGAGKTAFVRGAARALGVVDPVTSPTFAIGNLYAASGAARAGAAGVPAPAEVAHLDFYRLDAIDVSDEAVLDDFLGPDRVVFVEWPHDELAELPGVRAVVTLEHAGGDAREIEIAWRAAGEPADDEVPGA